MVCPVSWSITRIRKAQGRPSSWSSARTEKSSEWWQTTAVNRQDPACKKQHEMQRQGNWITGFLFCGNLGCPHDDEHSSRMTAIRIRNVVGCLVSGERGFVRLPSGIE